MAISENTDHEARQDKHQDVLRIVDNPESDLWKQGESIEAQVFIESGYVDTQEELAGEYEKYVPATRFAVAERNGVVGGAVRVINYNEEIGFKTTDDIKSEKLAISEEGAILLDNLDFSKTLEVGTLAVKKELRGLLGEEDRLAVVLYGVIYQMSQDSNCDRILASFDEKFFTKFKAIFDPGVLPLGPATDYMGSPTVPALIFVPELMEYASNVWGGLYDTMIEAGGKIESTQ